MALRVLHAGSNRAGRGPHRRRESSRWLDVVGGHWRLASALVAVAVLGALGLVSLSSGAVTVARIKAPAGATRSSTVAARVSTTATPTVAPSVGTQARLVRSDPVLMNHPRDPGPAQTVVLDLRRSRPKLSLALVLAAGRKDDAVRKFIIALPRGLAFARAGDRVADGTIVRVGTRPQKFTVRLAYGRLTINLARQARTVRVIFSSSALIVSRKLMQRIRAGAVKRVRIRFRAIHTRHGTAGGILRLRRP